MRPASATVIPPPGFRAIGLLLSVSSDQCAGRRHAERASADAALVTVGQRSRSLVSRSAPLRRVSAVTGAPVHPGDFPKYGPGKIVALRAIFDARPFAPLFAARG